MTRGESRGVSSLQFSSVQPFTEGRLGVNDKASPPGRHQEQAPKQRCTFSPTTFSSVQFSSVQFSHVFDHYIQSSVMPIPFHTNHTM